MGKVVDQDVARFFRGCLFALLLSGIFWVSLAIAIKWWLS